jgi:Diaminopimelate epimerase
MILEKYYGQGNDYIVYDPAKNKLDLNKKRIQLICNRNFGVGSDGILYGPILEKDIMKMRIYHPDGTETDQSNKEVHIFAQYLKDTGYAKEKPFVLIGVGTDVFSAKIEDNSIQKTDRINHVSSVKLAEEFVEELLLLHE